MNDMNLYIKKLKESKQNEITILRCIIIKLQKTRDKKGNLEGSKREANHQLPKILNKIKSWFFIR